MTLIETLEPETAVHIEGEALCDVADENRAKYARALAETAVKETSPAVVDKLMMPTGFLTREEFEKVQALAIIIENDGRCLDELPKDLNSFASNYGLDQPPKAFVEWLDTTEKADACATISELARALRQAIKNVIPADVPVCGIGTITVVAVTIIAKIVDDACPGHAAATKGVHSEFTTIYEDLSPEAESKL